MPPHEKLPEDPIERAHLGGKPSEARNNCKTVEPDVYQRSRAQMSYYISQINCKRIYTTEPCARFALGGVTTATLI